MTYAVAAAGTGGHVFPGLAVGEALVAAGVPRSDVLYVGGARMEQAVYPDAGFPFHQVELRGLVRSLDSRNLGIPSVVARAARSMAREFEARNVRVVLGMGGYVTIPAAIAARRRRIALMVAEQNAHAGLANRIAGRVARRRFGAFPTTHGLAAEWVGNPVRRSIAEFDRERLAAEAVERYGHPGDVPVVGIFGGSLGARAINEAILEAFVGWNGRRLAVLHIAGTDHAGEVAERAAASPLWWRVLGFEDRMDVFYSACDLIVARAGGAVAELTVTGSPAILVPGGFGSAGHQLANAQALEQAGSALVLPESDIGRIGEVVSSVLFDRDRLVRMAAAARTLARPDAADHIAHAMIDAHG